MVRIRITLKELLECIKFQSEGILTGTRENNTFVECYMHLCEHGFVFNEFTLVVEEMSTFKVKFTDDEHIKVKRIWELSDHTHKNETIEFSVIEFLNNMVQEMPRLRKMSPSEMLKSRDTFKNSWFIDVYPLMVTMEYIVYKAMHREVREMGTTKKRYSGSRNKSTSTKTEYKLIDCIRKYERHINHIKRSSPSYSFSVRGHYRHYKSGKVVWVKEFKKGKDLPEIIRDYKLGG